MGAGKSTRDSPDGLPTDVWDLALVVLASVFVALVELLFARYSGTKEFRAHTDPFTGIETGVYKRVWPRHDWLNYGNIAGIALVGVLVVLLVVGRVVWVRTRPAGPARDQPTFGVRKQMDDRWAKWVVASFVAGTLAGALARFLIGGVYVSSFATGSAPIVAGLLVAVIVALISDQGNIPWRRKLALTYLLIGSVATALGTINAPSGWFFAACFVVICGSLAAAVCLTADIILRSPYQNGQPTSGADQVAKRSSDLRV